MLFSEPKIPQLPVPRARRLRRVVSVLFSEPKIPQSGAVGGPPAVVHPFQCSSASRKFLNRARRRAGERRRAFQCSSASRKFLNPTPGSAPRAPATVSVLFSEPKIPQFPCASTAHATGRRFSALQRAENSSIVRFSSTGSASQTVFQCSSASRKFLNRRVTTGRSGVSDVSVLFSEPKIPQSESSAKGCSAKRGFSALQRAENSSIQGTAPAPGH